MNTDKDTPTPAPLAAPSQDQPKALKASPRPSTKRSINIERVALKIAAQVRNGNIVNIGKTMREVGYAKSTSTQPHKVTRSKTFKRATKPVLAALQGEIVRIQEAMESKDLRLEEYKVLNYALDTLIRNAQLLSGGATERQVLVLPSEIMEKNAIKQSEPALIDAPQE